MKTKLNSRLFAIIALICAAVFLGACTGGYTDPSNPSGDLGGLGGLDGLGGLGGLDGLGGLGGLDGLGGGGGGNDTGGGSGGGNIVGKWNINQALANAEAGAAPYEFTSDGKFLLGGMDTTQFRYTTSGGKIIFSSGGAELGRVDYSISGTRLTISNPTGTPTIVAGTYYKKA